MSSRVSTNCQKALGSIALSVFGALCLTSCSGEQSPTSPLGPNAAALQISAQVIASSATALRITSSFNNSAGQPQELAPPKNVSLGAGGDSVVLTIDITRCLAAGGSSNGCVASFTAELLRGTTTLDQQSIGPLTLKPNAVTSVSAPVILREVARVRIDSIAGSFSAPDVRDTVLMRALAFDIGDGPVAAKSVAWVSSDPTVASVRALSGDTAAVTALSAGATTLTATIGGRSASVSVNVRSAQISKITLTPLTLAAVVGDRTQLIATVTDKYNVALVPTPPVVFSSSDASVATVDSLGFVTALAQGNVTISATAGGKTGSATVSVTRAVAATVTPSVPVAQIEVGEQVSASVVVLDQRNRPITSPNVAWSTAAAAVATVDAHTGRITGVAPGTTDIVAAVGSVSGRVALRVVNATPASIAITPRTLSLSVGGTTALTGAVLDRRGAVLTGQIVSWQSLTSAVATVSANGTVTGVSAGTARIVASVATAGGALSDTATVTVVQGGSSQISSIDSVGTSTPVNIGNVSGTIDVDVTYGVSPGATATALRLLLGTQLQLSVTPNATTCPSFHCSFRVNTAAFDSTTGIAVLTNGPQSLRSELVLTNGVVTSNAITLTLNNSSGFIARVTSTSTNAGFPSSVVDPVTGRTWVGGDVTLTLRGVSYQSGQSYTRVSGQFLGRPFVDIPLTSGTTSLLFPSAAGVPRSIAGYQTTAANGDSVTLSAAVLSGGGAGNPQLLPRFVPVRVDNAAPTGGSFSLTLPVGVPNWLGATYNFIAGITPPADAGVGVSSSAAPTIQVTGCGASTWRTVGATANQVGQCASNNSPTAYQARAVFTDQLGNAVILQMQPRFGIDLTPPTVSFTTRSYADSAKIDLSFSTFPRSPSFDASATDNGSGVARTESFVSYLSPSGATCLVGTGAPGAQPLTKPLCGFVAGPLAYTLPSGQFGEFRYTARAIDVAGNVSASISRVVLLDGFLPSVSNVALAQPVPNVPLQLTASTNDDAELRNAAAMVVYPDLAQIFATSNSLGYGIPINSVPFDDVLTLSVPPITLRGGFIRYLETVNVSTDSVRSQVGQGTPPNVDLFATDYVLNLGGGTAKIVGVRPGVSWAAFNANNPSDRIYTFAMVASLSAGPTTGVKAEVRSSPNSTTAPFQRVDFFAWVPWPGGFNPTQLCYVGSSSAVVGGTAPSAHTWTYTLPTGTAGASCVDAGNVAAVAGVQMMAVGVSAAGDGLATRPVGLVP